MALGQNLTPSQSRGLSVTVGQYFSVTTAKKVIIRGPPREKRDGMIRHILERENGNWMEKLRYFVNYQSGIQRDWVNLA